MKKIFTKLFVLGVLLTFVQAAFAGGTETKKFAVYAKSSAAAGKIYAQPLQSDDRADNCYSHTGDVTTDTLTWSTTDSFQAAIQKSDYASDNGYTFHYWAHVEATDVAGYTFKGFYASATELTAEELAAIPQEKIDSCTMITCTETDKTSTNWKEDTQSLRQDETTKIWSAEIALDAFDTNDASSDDRATTYANANDFTPVYVYAVYAKKCTLNFSAEYDEMCDVWGVYADGQPLEYPYDNDNPYTFVEGTQISVGGMCTDGSILHEMVVTVNGEVVPADAFDPDTKVYTFTLTQDTNIKVVFNDPAPKTWTKTGYIMPSSSWGTDIFWTDACGQEVTVSGTEGSNELTISQDSKGYHNIIYVTANDDDTCASISYDYDYYGWGYFDFGSSYCQYMNTSYCYANADEENGYVTLYGWFDSSDNQYYVDIDWYDGAKEDAEAWKGIVTGINNVNAADNNAPVYNIAGQRVNNAQKGIFIKNGKKFMVK